MATKKENKKEESVVGSAVRNAALLSDGCYLELVRGAEFDGIFEIPIIKKPKKFIIPKNLVPFSKMAKADKKTFAVCEYENDTEFSDLLAHPDEYIEILKQYQDFISQDCSIYRDMPLAIQITNIYTTFIAVPGSNPASESHLPWIRICGTSLYEYVPPVVQEYTLSLCSFLACLCFSHFIGAASFLRLHTSLSLRISLTAERNTRS